VGPETNEAKLLAYYAAPLAFSPSGMLERIAPGSVRAGLELTYIPRPDDALRRTSKCFLPKDENSQLSSFVPRPRLAVGLPAGLFLEGTYLPPVTVADATPNMTSLALGIVRQLSDLLAIVFRGHTTLGRVRGPITCPEEALQRTDPTRACYGDRKSNDTYRPNIVGGEAAALWNGQGGFSAYLSAGLARLRPRFQVGFQPANTGFDSTRVETNLSRLSLALGGRYRLSRRLGATGELYSVPKDVTTLRLGASVTLR
jgi:hypothetical protein